MKTQIFFTTVFLFFCKVLFAQYAWTQKADFGPGLRDDASAFSIGSSGYAGLGSNPGPVFYKDWWQYDPVLNVWTQKANLPALARTGSLGFAIGNKGYVGLGETSAASFLTDFWEYDPVTNIWTQKSNFPGASRYTAVGIAIGNKGYVGTGGGLVLENDWWVYDPSLDQWTQLTSFPAAVREGAVAFSLNGYGYVGLGYNGTHFDDFWKFDTLSNSWTQVANYPGGAQRNPSSFVIGNQGYVGMGYNNITYMNDWVEYDPVLNVWSQIYSMGKYGRYLCFSFSLNNKGYCGTGYEGFDTKDFWEYGPPDSMPVAAFQSSDSIICSNSCINFTDLSSNATSWQWSFPGAIDSISTVQNPQNVCYSNSGSYNVMFIASNFGGSDTITLVNFITVHAIPSTPVIIQHEDTLFFNTDSSYSSYQWYLNNTTITGATDTFLIVSSSGNYNVQVTSENGCTTATGINVIIGLQNYYLNDLITLFPNPVTNELSIRGNLKSETIKLTVFNVLGERIYTREINPRLETINCRAFLAGIYFVQVESESNLWVGKFIKE